MQQITPCLWFNDNAEEAARFYVSVFKNAKIDTITHYGDGMPMPKGTVLTVTFTINGQDFMALNGGPTFTLNEAVSFMINCDSQMEIDDYWTKLTADGGKPVQCGWLKDKFGLSWQIVPSILPKLLGGDQAQTDRVMAAVVQMVKLDIAAMEKAAAG
ncbi:MAG TPA: VOC family protein [Pseudolabrys sp.]|nr:VOC family protein [Pseudolabrys sp.]